MVTMGIVEFLNAQYNAEAERLEWIVSCQDGDHDFGGGWNLWGDYGRAIDSAFQPKRMLADVAAKRRVLNALDAMVKDGAQELRVAADLIVRDLVAPYADQPDFNPDWGIPITEENRS